MNAVLSTAYWPNLQYMYFVFHCNRVEIETQEHYQKQSFRNRCRILSANGVLDLQIPIRHPGAKQKIVDVEISYSENWQIRHWRALESAYRKSPFFDFFESEIAEVYKRKVPSLLSFNLDQLSIIQKLLRIKKEIVLSTEFEKTSASRDLRDLIHPKKNWKNIVETADLLSKPYYQTFSGKFGFVPNLCILDLLFNTGLATLSYLEVPDIPNASPMYSA